MASRNKKGKIHGIFKSAFQVSFFHKPSMEGTDLYYYVIIDNIIFLKMRLLFDVVLVIDEIYPLTMTYIEPQYETLFNLLKDQTSVTVVVSLIGNTVAFRQTCMKFDTPIVEKEEFLDCSTQFYNKFKNYCQNDISRYGFYLIALKDDTFSAIEEQRQTNQQKVGVIIKEPDNIQNEQVSTPTEDKLYIPDWVSKLATRCKDIDSKVAIKLSTEDPPVYEIQIGSNDVLLVSSIKSDEVIVKSIISHVSTKMEIIHLLMRYGDNLNKGIRILTNDRDILNDMLNDNPSWTRIFGKYKSSYNTFCYNCKL